MYKYWLKYKEDIVSFCKILSTIIAIATFFGFSVHVKDKSKKPLYDPIPIVKNQILVDNQLK